jgi:hypothetical protein
MFNSDITDINKEGELVTWSSVSNIDYIKNLEKVTYNTGYVLDLNFLNIFFVIISIQTDMYCVLDYEV